MRSQNARLSRCLSVVSLVVLSACWADSTPDASSGGVLTRTQPTPTAEAVSQASSDADGARRKSPIPRLESGAVRVTKRVLPEIAAVGSDKAGDTKACRISFILNVSGSPSEVRVVDCEPAYASAVTESAKQWLFQPTNGTTFPSKVRIVREIQFTLK